jgi:hypothetical protein
MNSPAEMSEVAITSETQRGSHFFDENVFVL